MTKRLIKALLAMAAMLMAGAPQAQQVVRLGNLKSAHYGAVAYMKEVAPQCGIRVEERQFAREHDMMQAIIGGELDVGATASEAAIAGRADGAPILVVAGFAKAGVRLVARRELSLRALSELKGRKVGVTRGGMSEVLLLAELAQHGLSASEQPGKDVQLLFPADLNQALKSKNIDAMMQSEPLSSQAIKQGFGVELLKPYDTPIGEPVRTLVMTEKFYREQHMVAAKFMLCFVHATGVFIQDRALAERYIREVIFKHEINADDLRDAIANSSFVYDITPEHIQLTTDAMVKAGVGRMTRPPLAKDWVRTDLLAHAKYALNLR
jgi:NitT/TauT family transport system substrate-binding protein